EGLGRGWRLSYDTRLYAVARGWQIVQADGARWYFGPPPSPGQACAALQTGQGRLWQQEDGFFRWEWPQGRRLTFASDGRLVAIVDPDGSQLELVWGMLPGRDDFQRLIAVRDGWG